MGVQGALLPRVQQGSPTEVLRVPRKHQDVVRVQKLLKENTGGATSRPGIKGYRFGRRVGGR
ncbi:unnamed protein product [Ectocarpus sp. CCAP 1310/34]|nr:unnamed protein product [Ectocarpus sp. CCAP 1310/34]